MIIRYGQPSKYDHAPFGTTCKNISDMASRKIYDIYAQMNIDESNPRWELVGTFAENVPDYYVNDEIEKFVNFKL